MAELSLRVPCLFGAADESVDAFSDVVLRNARILLSAIQGSLGSPSLARNLEAASVGVTEVFGPVIREHSPQVSLGADGATMAALTEAIAHCRAALPPPKKGACDDDDAAEEREDESQAGQRAGAAGGWTSDSSAEPRSSTKAVQKM